MDMKKKRAAFAGGLLLIQAAQMVLMLGIMLTKEISLKEGFLPEAVRQFGMLAVLIVITLLYYLFMGKKKSFENAAFIAVGGIAVLMSFADLFFFTKAVKMTGTDKPFYCLVLLIMVAWVAIAVIFSEKHSRFPMAIVIAGTALFVTTSLLKYRNEVLNQKVMIPMFIVMAVMLIAYLYMSEKLSKYVGLVLVLVQIVVSVVAYLKIKKSENIVQAIEGFFKGLTEKQLMNRIIVALLIMAALTIVLQFIKHYEIVGKLLCITLIGVILMTNNVIGAMETEAAESFGVDVTDAATNAVYGVFVRIDDSAETLDDIKNYKIAIHKEHDVAEISAAVSKLEEQAGTLLDIVTYENLSELGAAFYNREVNAVFIERSTATYIDAEYESKGIEWIFSEDTKVIADVSVDFVQPVADPDQQDDPDNPVEPVDPIKGEQKDDLTTQSFLIYISGIDVYGDINTKSRSDVNVLMAVNPVTKEIGLVTTPRDAYLEIPGKTKEGSRDKLTHAGNYGVNYSIATLEQLYGLNIDYYVRINFSGVQNVVNLLGGVDVVSLYNFTARHGNYPFKKGVNHMNGAQAVSFARERITLPGGDVTRGKHHIELIKGVFAKATTTAVLTNYQSLLDAVSSNFQTDMSTSEIAALAGMQLSDNAEWHFTSYASYGDGDMRKCASYSGGELWVCLLKQDSVTKAAGLLQRVLNGEHIADGEYEYEQ